jgi:outer membrane protein TolC
MLRSASTIADDRYNAGILNILDLTQVRRQDFANRSQLLRVRAERLRQRLNLHLALGGSFDTRETQP